MESDELALLDPNVGHALQPVGVVVHTGHDRGVLPAPVDRVDQTVAAVSDLVERIDDRLPAEFRPGLQQPGHKQVGVDPTHHGLLGHGAAVGRHPLVVGVSQLAVAVVLERNEEHQHVVAVEEPCRLGHEARVVGVGVEHGDLISHPLPFQFLGQGEHAVDIHGGGDEIHAGFDHLRDLGPEAIGQAEGQVVVDVHDL